MDKVPEWAIERALKYIGVGGQPVCHVVKAFARYIAEHEDPPADPLEEAFADAFEGLPIGTIGGWMRPYSTFRRLLDERGIKVGCAQ